mgnify:CR=1 FL=1
MNKIDTLSLSAGNKVEEIVPIISGKVNVADYLEKQVELQPNKRAVIVPEGLNKEGRYRYSHLTFAQLLDRTNFYAHAMTAYGIGFGDRVLVGIRHSDTFWTKQTEMNIDRGSSRRRCSSRLKDANKHSTELVKQVSCVDMIA